MSNFNRYSFFRYFNGEKECPYKEGYKIDAWWFERTYSYLGDDVCNDEMLGRYMIAGLRKFYKDSGLPITYLSFIFYKMFDFGSIFENVEYFKRFIEQCYPNQ